MNLIYITLTAFNLVLPFLWFLGFTFLTVLFAGFPISSGYAKRRLNSLIRLSFAWTFSRLLWGCIALSSVLGDWMQKVGVTDIPHYYAILLVSTYTSAPQNSISYVIRMPPATIRVQCHYYDSFNN